MLLLGLKPILPLCLVLPTLVLRYPLKPPRQLPARFRVAPLMLISSLVHKCTSRVFGESDYHFAVAARVTIDLFRRSVEDRSSLDNDVFLQSELHLFLSRTGRTRKPNQCIELMAFPKRSRQRSCFCWASCSFAAVVRLSDGTDVALEPCVTTTRAHSNHLSDHDLLLLHLHFLPARWLCAGRMGHAQPAHGELSAARSRLSLMLFVRTTMR